MVGQRVGRYRVMDKIGKGGMGEVYLAEDTSLGRKVALKFISAKLQEDEIAHRRFIREAKSAAALDHPFICNVHEVSQTEDRRDFIVMEFVPGKSLNKLLATGPLSLVETLKILQETAEALQEAHKKGIAHRDLKPSNIMVTTGGHAKVMDFGLAKKTEQSDDPEITSVLTKKGQVLGTPAYMAPEQLKGESCDIKVDIFSLGVIGLQMLTGEHPFHKRSIPATVAAILNDRPKGLESPSLPEEMRAILGRMLQKDPKKRYQECGELLDDLQEAIGVLSYPTGTLELNQKSWWQKHSRTVRFASPLMAILLAVFLYEPIIDFLQLGRLPENITVVVLPPQLTTRNQEHKAFAVGLTESLSESLRQLSSAYPFNVIQATLTRSKDVVTTDQIEKRLGANLALTPSFEVNNGEVVEIRLYLETDASERRLRRASISAPYDKPMAIQTLLIEESVKMLGSQLQPSDRQSAHEVGFSNPRAYHFYLRGLGYQVGSDGDLDVAINDYERALTFEGGSAAARARLGLAQFEKGTDMEKALANCRRAQQMDGTNVDAKICQGEVLLQKNRPEEALSFFESAADMDPTNDVVWNHLRRIYQRLDMPDKAEALLETAIDRQPTFFRPRSQLAVFYQASGRYQEAIEQLHRVTEMAPKYGSAYNTMAVCYAQLFCWHEALRMWEKAREFEEKLDLVGTNIATAYYFTGRFGEAIDEAETAVIHLRDKIKEKDQHVNYGNVGDIHHWAPGGSIDTADDCYERAISLAEELLDSRPGDIEILGYLALYHAMIGQHDQAADYLNRALESEPSHPQTLYRAALVERMKGNRERSLEHLKSFLESGGNPRQIAQDPAFEEIRKLQDYQTLVSQYPYSSECPPS